MVRNCHDILMIYICSPNSHNNSQRRPSIGAVAEHVDETETIEMNPINLARGAETVSTVEATTPKPDYDILDSPEPQLDPLWSSHSSGFVLTIFLYPAPSKSLFQVDCWKMYFEH